MTEWTEEEVVLLKKLVEKGQTSREIAESFPGHSRNSVIGKAHRLGIKLKRPVGSVSEQSPAIVSTPRVARPPQQVDRFIPPRPVVATKILPDSPTSESPHVSWADHEEWMCHCMYDDKSWCSGRKAPLNLGGRAGTSNWCEFHRSKFTIERKK